MTETTQDGADVVERLDEWLRLNEPLDPVDYYLTITKSVVRDAHAEITRLRSDNERLKSIEALVREYVSERDAPVQDIGYRAALLNRIREALQETSNG